MAVVSGTIKNIALAENSTGVASNSSGNMMQSCIVTATFSGTYAQADGAAVAAITTAIQNSRRDGKTVTLVDAMCDNACVGGTAMGADTVAKSGTGITCKLTKTDLVTEHDNATVINNDPVAFRVSYILS